MRGGKKAESAKKQSRKVEVSLFLAGIKLKNKHSYDYFKMAFQLNFD